MALLCWCKMRLWIVGHAQGDPKSVVRLPILVQCVTHPLHKSQQLARRSPEAAFAAAAAAILLVVWLDMDFFHVRPKCMRGVTQSHDVSFCRLLCCVWVTHSTGSGKVVVSRGACHSCAILLMWLDIL